jgi:hypothetical protein
LIKEGDQPMERREKEMKDVEGSLREAKATLAIEGISLTPEEEALLRRRLRREINRQEFLKRASEMAEGRTVHTKKRR